MTLLKKTEAQKARQLDAPRRHRRHFAAWSARSSSVPGNPSQAPLSERWSERPRWSEPPGGTDVAMGIGSMVIPPHVLRARNQELRSEVEPSGELGGDIQDRIRLLEERLDRMLEHVPEPAPADQRDKAPPLRLAPDRGVTPLDKIRASDFYQQQWGRSGLQDAGHEVDEFGMDPRWEQWFVQPLVDFLYSRWFRVETRGIEHVPAAGRCLVVANHSGTLPLDGPILRAAFRREHPTSRNLRWLAEDFLYFLPYVGTGITRAGAVRACPENAERLLEREELVASFPEGVKGISKLYRERYRLQRFGRGGFVRLALRTRTPIVPCAVIGAEETAPILYRDEAVARWLGLPYLPVTPTFPWLGLFGLLPAPVKWKLVFGEPISMNEYGPADAEDDVLVGRLAERVRATVQRLLDAAVRDRHSVWLG
jgi:1-acyl-sn-glycerol-3-phosphate acyltransferase